MLKRVLYLLVTAILILPLSCMRNTRTSVSSLRFAVIGNTYPESPFDGFNTELALLVKELNRANPAFVFHMGNIVYGGNRWMGIKEIDVIRQYKEFNKYMGRLGPLLYTIPGAKDSLDGKLDIYRKFTGRDDYYSFNYGAVHFIVLKTSGNGEIIDSVQMGWLESDLKKNRDAQAVFVFAHNPLFMAGGKKITLNAGEKLHRLFKFYPVKAVFSGNRDRYYRVDYGGIQYHVTGCRLLHDKSWSRYRSHYYIIDFDGHEIKVEEKELDFSK